MQRCSEQSRALIDQQSTVPALRFALPGTDRDKYAIVPNMSSKPCNGYWLSVRNNGEIPWMWPSRLHLSPTLPRSPRAFDQKGSVWVRTSSVAYGPGAAVCERRKFKGKLPNVIARESKIFCPNRFLSSPTAATGIRVWIKHSHERRGPKKTKRTQSLVLCVSGYPSGDIVRLRTLRSARERAE